MNKEIKEYLNFHLPEAITETAEKFSNIKDLTTLSEEDFWETLQNKLECKIERNHYKDVSNYIIEIRYNKYLKEKILIAYKTMVEVIRLV